MPLRGQHWELMGLDKVIKLLRIHSAEGFGDRSIFKIFQETQDVSEVLDLIENREGKRPKLSVQEASRLADYMYKEGIRVIPSFDADYPKALKNIFDPPPIIYAIGQLPREDAFMIAVVGTRRCSRYGSKVVSLLVPQLVNHGFVIVSGMALGIDTLAHQTCLDCGGSTIAVLGSGVDVIRPLQNSGLYWDIIRNGGCVLSELMPGTESARYTFPQRNRIISGLSQGVVVVEAGDKSGSLITADFALEQGKDVFAVPGDIFNYASAGTNRLLQNGAIPLLGVEDVLGTFGLDGVAASRERIEIEFSDELERSIYQALAKGEMEIDALIERLEAEVELTLATISRMELKGFVARQGSKIELQR